MKLNHKINKYASAFFLAGALTLSSCGEESLEMTPQQSISSELAFADKLTAKGSLMGVYSRAQSLYVFGGMPLIISDYMADNINFTRSSSSLRSINNYSTLSNNGSIRSIWESHFLVTAAANAVIAKVPMAKDPSFSDAEKAQFVAEAKFMRALIYFQMVNFFAHPYQVENGVRPGVPLVLKPYTIGAPLQPRASVNEVHAQIEKDLTDAANALPNKDNKRATKSAAWALLSRLHLYRGEWQKAADYAKKVMDSGVFTLANDFGFYSKNTPEEIFSLQNSATDNGADRSAGLAKYHMPTQRGGRGMALVSKYLLSSYDKNDKRLKDLTFVFDGKVYTNKYSDAVNDSDNAPIIRVTEVYLNKAEALAELKGINAESISIINKLRTRAGLSNWTATTFSSKSAFLDAIAEERRKELCFEGHRRMDLLRRGKALRPESDPHHAKSKLGEPRTVLPIPQQELDVNKLVQNQGY